MLKSTKLWKRIPVHPSKAARDSAPSHLNSQRREVGSPCRYKQNQEPQHQREAEQAGLHQHLRIVVVRFIHEQIGIEAAVTGVDGWESAQAPPQHRPVEKHSQAVLRNIPTDARSQVSESAQNLPFA